MPSKTETETITVSTGLTGILETLAIYFTVPIWVLGLVVAAFWGPVGFILLFVWPTVGVLSLTLMAVFIALPLTEEPPPLLDRFLRHTMISTRDYFPLHVEYVNREAFSEKDKPYIIAYEPHSVLPQAVGYFGKYSDTHPDVLPVLGGARILTSSAGFWAPVMRNLWWWLGCRPVARDSFRSILASGRSLTICPGGVQECLYMGHGREVVYLRRRRGFVKLAIEAGAPIIPVFAFGQTESYRYIRFFIDVPLFFVPRASAFSLFRRIGYVPMFIFGWLGSAMPHRVPINVLVGEPIKVPKIADPDNETVQKYLDTFIDTMETMFEENKARFGYPDLKLVIH